MIDVERMDPARYRRVPWKNGGGVSVEIASEDDETRDEGAPGWSYGRTSIVAAGPFSDWSGHDRLQVVIAGRGLVLATSAGEIDLREPFRPQRYDGGLSIVTRLESGPVEVVNLIVDRRRFAADLSVGTCFGEFSLRPGRHIVHAAAGAATVVMAGVSYDLAEDSALQIVCDGEAQIAFTSGRVLIGTIRTLSA